jgi:cytoskeletal protein RodZ
MSLKSAHTGKVGKAFINARNRRSISPEEAASLTLINIEYINAIESGDYSIFPARIFAVQYFEKYAKFLDLEIDFFDIYNAEVVAEAELKSNPDTPKRSFFKKNIFYIIFICSILLTFIIFIFQNNQIAEVLDGTLQESLINTPNLKIDEEPSLENDINLLHGEINNFFIQDKLDSIQLDVTVDSLEPDV